MQPMRAKIKNIFYRAIFVKPLSINFAMIEIKGIDSKMIASNLEPFEPALSLF